MASTTTVNPPSIRLSSLRMLAPTLLPFPVSARRKLSYIHAPRVGAERPESGQSIGGLNSSFWVGSGQAGNITDDVINNYLNEHAAKDGFSPSA